jgi:hypothetical protein
MLPGLREVFFSLNIPNFRHRPPPSPRASCSRVLFIARESDLLHECSRQDAVYNGPPVREASGFCSWRIPWSWVLQKPTVAQPLRKFPAFHGTRRFIAVFTRARHWSLSWARLIQSTLSPNPISSRPVFNINPLSLVRTTEELLERKSSGSDLENRD